MNATYDAIVLAGGGSSRMDGVDKCALQIGGRTLLDHVLDPLDARHIVVVGPLRATTRGVSWTREQPAGGGPVAAIEAGLAALDDSAAGAVVVLAADTPFAARAVPRLLAALAGFDAAVLVDATGHEQPLVAAYDKGALAEVIRGLPAVRDVPARRLLDRLHHSTVTAEGAEALDCDDAASYDTARRMLET